MTPCSLTKIKNAQKKTVKLCKPQDDIRTYVCVCHGHGSLINQNMYKIQKKIGGGSFGDIYEGVVVKRSWQARPRHHQTTVAVKFERVGATHPQLAYESRIYATLHPTMHGCIPSMHYFGTEGEFNILVLDKLGMSLEQLRVTQPQKRFTWTHVAVLAVRMLRTLEKLHDHGFIHRDLKPENILLHQPLPDYLNGTVHDALQTVMLIDFGLSKKITDPHTGAHIPHKTGKHLTGTPRYASVSNHKGHEQGRKDDLESLGYVLMYLFHGHLPWQHKRVHGDAQEYASILKKKQAFLNTSLRNQPVEIQAVFDHAATLQFAQRPRYDDLVRMFTNRSVAM